MGFHQGTKPQVFTDFKIPGNGLRIQQAADEEHTVGAHNLCLVQLIGIHRKVLPDHGRFNMRPDLTEDIVRPQEVPGLRKAGNRIRAGLLVLSCNLQIVKHRVNDSFGRRGLLYLADKRHAGLSNRLIKGIFRLPRERFRERFHFPEAYLLPVPHDPNLCFLCQLLQYRHRLLTSINCSSFS